MRVIKPNWVEHTGGLCVTRWIYADAEADTCQAGRRRRNVPYTPCRSTRTERGWLLEGWVSLISYSCGHDPPALLGLRAESIRPEDQDLVDFAYPGPGGGEG